MKYCRHCGKEIADEAVLCIHCGCEIKPSASIVAAGAEGATPPTATWAMVCGIASFFIGWLALGITAIVLANLSKEDTNWVMCKSAKVGFVCGIISCVLFPFLLVLIIVAMGSLIGTAFL